MASSWAMAEGHGEQRGFGAELNRLCDERWPGGSRTANVELAEAIGRHVGRPVDRQYVWRIRKGRVKKVDSDVRDAICIFFGLPLDYFSTRGDVSSASSTSAEHVAHGDELRNALRSYGLTIAGLRAADNLSEAGRRDLGRILDEAVALLEREQGR